MNDQHIDIRYHNLYGRLAGYLPKNRAAVDQFQQQLKQQVVEARTHGTSKATIPSVKALAELIETNGIVRMYVTQMVDQQPLQHKTIDSVEGLLECLSHIASTAPGHNPSPNEQNFFASGSNPDSGLPIQVNAQITLAR